VFAHSLVCHAITPLPAFADTPRHAIHSYFTKTEFFPIFACFRDERFSPRAEPISPPSAAIQAAYARRQRRTRSPTPPPVLHFIVASSVHE
jgi:hypothetical protein